MELTCNGCGNEFEAQRKDARYCSPRCRTRAHRERGNVGKPKQKRIALTRLFAGPTVRLWQQTNRLEFLLSDDRFRRNRELIADQNIAHLKHARAQLDRVISALEE